jgi:hypothetical protein
MTLGQCSLNCSAEGRGCRQKSSTLKLSPISQGNTPQQKSMPVRKWRYSDSTVIREVKNKNRGSEDLGKYVIIYCGCT